MDIRKTESHLFIRLYTYGGMTVPEHIIDGLARYFEFGTPTGSGLRRILEGDLYATVNGLDVVCQQNLAVIARCIQSFPVAAWGADENVKEWISAGGVKGHGGWKNFGGGI